MRKDTQKYREWIKKRNAKLLKKRTKNKNKRTHNHFSIKSKTTAIKTEPFFLPTQFSLIKNTENVIRFFNHVLGYIKERKNYGERIFFDISDSKDITIDALMYLLAVIDNLKTNFKLKYYFAGNEPKDVKANTKFRESGFYNYVKSNNSSLFINSNKIQISSGYDANPKFARDLLDFISHEKKQKRSFRYLYDIAIELMSNTKQHAYNNDKNLKHKWYCYAEKLNKYVYITFMDTGEGIPSTVKKRKYEELIRTDSDYVMSALDTHIRTSSNMFNRGKGLPQLKKYCRMGKIKEMYIISNKAKVIVKGQSIKREDLNCSLNGTLYNFVIDRLERENG